MAVYHTASSKFNLRYSCKPWIELLDCESASEGIGAQTEVHATSDDDELRLPRVRPGSLPLAASTSRVLGENARAVKRFKRLSKLHVVRQVDLVAGFGTVGSGDDLTSHLRADIV